MLKRTALILFTIIMLFTVGILMSCQAQEEEYRTVTPTKEELEPDEILYRLDNIFSSYFKDYDCTTEDMYDNLFKYNYLAYVVPMYPEEIAQMMGFTADGVPHRLETFYEKDPLGYFGEITENAVDKDGIVYNGVKDGTLIGHHRYSAKYIDWIVEGVWNGKVNHDKLFVFDDGSKCYYHDGYYYLPEEVTAIGGGIFHITEIKDVIPAGNDKYEVKYTVYRDNYEPYLEGSSVITMKESENSFRFWSILSIDVTEV